MENRLRFLEQFPAHSLFCRQFYGLIAQWIREAGEPGDGIRVCFERFLDVQIWLHSELVRIQDSGEGTEESHGLFARRRERAILAVCDVLDAIPTGSEEMEGLRSLILAECYYQLGDQMRVINHLSDAVLLGRRHPIVFFSLGWNQYAKALKECAELDPATGRLRICSPSTFRLECILAVSYLDQGLDKPGYRRQIQLLRLRILQSLGLAHDGDAELDAAAGGIVDEGETASAPSSRPLLPAISQDEAEAFDALLARANTVTDLLSG